MTTKKRDTLIYIYLGISVLCCLVLATRSSFLYPLNNWDDANSYFSMGKALFNGKMLYRDVFDQKGMYLYFLYGLSYLVSHTTFTGVFILEAVLGFVDIAFFYRIITMFTGSNTHMRKMLAGILATFTFAAIVCSRSFWWGGAAEEICLPFYVIGLYLTLDYFKNGYPNGVMPFKTVLLGGIMAGFIANIKFTGLGFFFAWMMMVFFSYLAHKEVALGIKACFVFLFGMFLPFVPWIIYFGIQGGLYEWYWGYVYVNVFVYTKVESENPGLLGKLKDLAKILYWLIRDDWQYFAPVIVGMFGSVLGLKKKLLARLNVPVLFAFMFLGFFGGGRELPYYSLPLSVFAVLGFSYLGYVITTLAFSEENGQEIRDKAGNNSVFEGIAAAVCLALSTVFIFLNSMNIPFMKVTRDSYFMYRFRDEVLETENSTLLNVGCLDAGLYTLCDIVPSCRWFQTQTLNIDEPENSPYLEQERYVREGLIDYVLVRDHLPDSINDHYDLIDKEIYGWDGNEFTYYLYRKAH
ncbi:hypothetical protein [Butyrivibrio sp. VCD2006]|uniref:hypothetical protein n=1 Tax=Butyrivibrio sp. VCD2006 TaxID=1280664 RepID=UPI000428FE37|nr:hypothetical protein [Butyrivibrio sp. VCD2006]